MPYVSDPSIVSRATAVSGPLSRPAVTRISDTPVAVELENRDVLIEALKARWR